MKGFIVAVLLLTATTVQARRDKSKPLDLTGNWKETHRLSLNGDMLAYKDTTRIDFLTGNEYTWQKGISFLYRGTYKATTDVVDLGARIYQVRHISRDRIEVTDNQFIYEFRKISGPEEEAAPASAQEG